MPSAPRASGTRRGWRWSVVTGADPGGRARERRRSVTILPMADAVPILEVAGTTVVGDAGSLRDALAAAAPTGAGVLVDLDGDVSPDDLARALGPLADVLDERC